MPYKSMDEVNPAIKGIKPPVTLAQANIIASWADEIEDVESPWAVAIGNWKKAYRVEDGKWVKRAAEVDMGELNEAVTKSVSGKDLPASSFLVVGDAEEVGTWALPVKDAAGKADHRLMGGAWAATHGGYRGKKYEGPNKAAAITKLKALYKAEDMPIPGTAEAAPEAVALISEALAMMSLSEQERRVRDAFLEAYNRGRNNYEVSAPYWVKDVFIDPSEFGNALVAEDNRAGRYYLVSFSENGEEIVFADPPTWKIVVPTYRVETATAEADDSPSELETVKIAEAYAGVELLTEGIAEADAQGPLTMKVQPIRPGFGRKRDNHYYPAAMLKRDARVMVGAKMYETDHKQKDKSTRTWVSTITDVLGFSDAGAPVCEVVVHDPNFAQRVRNLAEKDLLDRLECSVLGDGKIKRNQMREGRKTNVVEALTLISSVDWVTKAGAGGKALAIAESDKDGNMDEKDPKETETPKEEAPKVEAPQKDAEPQGQVLEAVPVLKALLTSGLPQAAQERLAEGDYADEDTLKAAIDAEKAYLEAARPSEGGRPFGMGGAEPKREEDEKPLAERETAIVNKYIGR